MRKDLTIRYKAVDDEPQDAESQRDSYWEFFRLNHRSGFGEFQIKTSEEGNKVKFAYEVGPRARRKVMVFLIDAGASEALSFFVVLCVPDARSLDEKVIFIGANDITGQLVLEFKNRHEKRTYFSQTQLFAQRITLDKNLFGALVSIKLGVIEVMK